MSNLEVVPLSSIPALIAQWAELAVELVRSETPDPHDRKASWLLGWHAALDAVEKKSRCGG